MAGSRDIRALTGNEQLWRWNASEELGTPVVVTFSFSRTKPAYDDNDWSGFTGFSKAQKQAARAALDIWAEKSGLTFIEVSPELGGQIRFAKVDMEGIPNATGGPAKGFGYFPNPGYEYGDGELTIVPLYDTLGGDVFMSASAFSGSGSMNPGTAGFSILLHEIGHAIGFKHPFEGEPTLPGPKDNGGFTVMSYNRSNSATELGSLDIEAAQFYYGNKAFKHDFNEKTKVLKLQGTSKADIMLGTELKDVIKGKGGKDKLIGSLGTDKLDGGGKADTLIGGEAKDRLSGGGGNDRLDGDLGKDKLIGGAGRDVLSGGDGNDVSQGGKGKDRLESDAGSDSLAGGKGADIFVLNYVTGETEQATDSVQDFDGSQGDRIDLSGYGGEWAGFDQPFHFIGKEAFSFAPGELRYETDGKDSFIYGDFWGTGTPELTIVLRGVTEVSEADFIL